MAFITKEAAKSLLGVSGLGDKLANLPESRQTESICCWSDLLGFATPLVESNWQPDASTWNLLTDRTVNAHLQCYLNLIPTTEFVLTLPSSRSCNTARRFPDCPGRHRIC